MKPHKKPKIPKKPRVPRWTAHMEAKAREVPSTPAKKISHSKEIPHPIPTGTLRADPAKQVIGWSDEPKYFYQDKEFTCRSCGKMETWTALQQRWWYEIARGRIDTTAVVCRACRKAKRASDAESLHKAWMARFERLKRLQPQLEKTIWTSDPGDEIYTLMNRPLSLFRLTQAALSACSNLRIETLGDLISYKFTSPLPDFHLSDWDALLRLLKVKVKLG